MSEFSQPIDVRFSDLDLYGHVNSVTFFAYLETARVKLFQDFFQTATEAGLLLVVARAECDYRLPILLHDPVVVSIQVPRIGSSSFDLAYRVHDGLERVYATAKTTLVTYSATSQRAEPMPEWARSCLCGVGASPRSERGG